MYITENKKLPYHGAALITVLVIVFVITAIIANLNIRSDRIVRRLTNQNVQQQAYAIVDAAIDFGRAGLATSAATSQVDSLNDIWAQPLPQTKVIGDFQLSGYIVDEQGKFNINDLIANGNINIPVVQQLSKLFTYLNIPSSLANNIALYIASPANQANIMSQYTTTAPAYRPAGRPLIDISELALVKGMQLQWLFKMSQYVSVIPQTVNYQSLNPESSSSGNNSQKVQSNLNNMGSVLVNINTAPAEVIAAKSGIPLSIAQQITTVRNSAPFKSQQDITGFLAKNGVVISTSNNQNSQNININTLTTQSSYFTIHAIVNDNNYQFNWIALVYRPTRSGQWPQILWWHPE